VDIVTEIAVAQFADTHQELFHYTDYDGLRGIYCSNSLWSMQYNHLNDATEFEVIKEPLISTLSERFRVLLIRLQRERLSVKLAIKQTCSPLISSARQLAIDFVNDLYKSSLLIPSERSAYITSFCTHISDDYSTKNGLLSQWRGYGGLSGGYCIVLDTSKLLPLLKQEYSEFHWLSLRMDPVSYKTENFSIAEAFTQLLDECEQFIIAQVEHKELPLMAIAHFLRAVAVIKHQGFREENEVRIVSWPATVADSDELRRLGRTGLPPLKTVHTIGQSGRRHISLFETLNAKLPVKRVIVGPSSVQEENYRNARALLSTEIELTRSETPFVEQARVR
jgi:hypothetical protein